MNAAQYRFRPALTAGRFTRREVPLKVGVTESPHDCANLLDPRLTHREHLIRGGTGTRIDARRNRGKARMGKRNRTEVIWLSVDSTNELLVDVDEMTGRFYEGPLELVSPLKEPRGRQATCPAERAVPFGLDHSPRVICAGRVHCKQHSALGVAAVQLGLNKRHDIDTIDGHAGDVV